MTADRRTPHHDAPRRRTDGPGARARAAVRVCLLALVAVGAVTWVGGSPSAQVRLPDFGDPAEQVLTPAEERVLGEAFLRALRSRVTVVDDPLVEGYIQSLGYRLAAVSDRSDLGFTFFVVEDRSLNAFAAPGGIVGLNSGLIVETTSESELASVLAHEIAHVTQRHIVQGVEQAGQSTLPVLAAVLAAIVVGTRNPEAGHATAAAVIGSAAQSRINFTRQNEREADRVGIRLLSEAGFDPREMAGVFEKLQNAARYSQRPPELLSTHPVSTDRIAEARDRAARLPYRQHESSEAYYMVRTRLRVHDADDPREMLDRLVDELDAGHAQSPLANVYGQALAMTRLGREEDARAVLERLVAAHPDNLTFRAELAGNVLRTGDPSRALALYSEGLELYPDDRVLVRGHAAALIEADRPADALALIDDYGELYPLDAEMHRLRADAYEMLGRTTESRADLAEHHYLSGRLDHAIEQLRLASDGRDRDFYRISRIEARLNELVAERKLRLLRR